MVKVSSQFKRVGKGTAAARRALWTLATAVGLLVALVLAAPVLPGWLSALVYAGMSFVCHQRPERSFAWGTAQFAVCARCTGIYLGAAIAAMACAGAGPHAAQACVSGRGPSARTLLLAGAAPTLLTVLAEVGGGWATSNYTRFGAGLPFGGSAVVVLAAAVAMTTLHYE